MKKGLLMFALILISVFLGSFLDTWIRAFGKHDGLCVSLELFF